MPGPSRHAIVAVSLAIGCGGSKDVTPPDTAAALDPSPDCLADLDCIEAVDPDNYAIFEARYAEGGECWTSASVAASCVETCQADILTRHALDPGEEACWPEGLPDMQVVLATSTDWSWSVNRRCEFPYEDIDIAFAANRSGQEFSLDFDATFDVYGTMFDTTCVATGWPFTCEPAMDWDYYTYTVLGTFSNEFRAVELTVEYYYEPTDSTYTCVFTGSS